ncbi:MAG: DnaJ C-terminal domain-containing protein [Actinomycetota bacterium]|nr:DnaJ C-terminal domain-containing protein [Actinomycetota bacterium]
MSPQREWYEKDYYAALGVPQSASAKEIVRAYRQLARTLHPDRNPRDARAEERFKEVSAAYDVVGDPTRRKEYDQVRRGRTSRPPGAPFTTDDLGDLFGGVFRRGDRFSRGPQQRPRKGPDLEADLHLSFDDAISGVVTSVNLTSDAVCRSCRGTGAQAGTRPRACSRCSGRGVLDDNQGLFSFSQPCPACEGRGIVIDNPCRPCDGAGVERRPREVRVRVPAGIGDGARLRLEGRGGPGRDGGRAGDLIVTVHVAPHERFSRSGLDLTVRVPVTYPEAALGAEIAAPTPDGGSVTIRVPPGTPGGSRFRVRGRGVATADATGDLIVRVDIAVPAQMSAHERAAVEKLDVAITWDPRAVRPTADEPPEDEPPADGADPAGSDRPPADGDGGR